MSLFMGKAHAKGGVICVALCFQRPSPLIPCTAGRIRRFHPNRSSPAIRGTLEGYKIRGTFGNKKFSSRAGNNNNNNRSQLSRKERRLLERKERNRAKRASKTSQPPPTSEKGFAARWKKISSEKFSAQGLQNFLESWAPRLPGRNVSFTHRSLWMALGLRFPLFAALAFVMTNEKTSPYVVQGSLGPSMLPTIQFVGDIWLVETRAWQRAINWILGKQEEDLESIYAVGDLVIWEDTKTGKRSCKRIVGLEGDTMDRFGEYKTLYRTRSDGGVLWPKAQSSSSNHHMFGSFSTPDSETEPEESEQPIKTQKQLDGKVVVPKQCVWLEGDCPLFSMDSRQYGPIHSSHIRGKLVFRLWPWNRDDLTDDEENSYLSSCYISKKRPTPYSTIEAYIGKRFGLFRVESSSNENSSSSG